MKTEYQYLEQLKQLIQDKEGWGKYAEWNHAHFERLSQSINTSTGTNLSLITLKRFFGKYTFRTKHNPHLYTKDAMAKYLGYKDWGDFKNNNNHDIKKEEKQIKNLIEFKKGGKITLIALGFILLVACILILAHQLKTPQASIVASSLMAYPDEQVTFHYTSKNIDKDSLQINFTYNLDNPTPPITLHSSNDSTYWHYYYPDYYRIILFTRKHPNLAEANVIILSKEWLLKTSGGKYGPIITPRTENGMLYIKPSDISKQDIDTTQYFQSAFFYFKDFGLNLDDCKIIFRLKNDVVKTTYYCNFNKLIIYGKNKKIKLNITDKRCTNRSFVNISDRAYNGATHNLEQLGHNLDQWINLEVKVKNQKALFSINDTLVFEGDYGDLLGDLVGLDILFNSTGKIDFIKAYDENDSLKYFEDFGGAVVE